MHLDHTITSRILTLASATISCLLSSCAVLTVDVDVYKGPLMNEERVQMLQLLSIAEAAKPLLVTLRDSIEWRDQGGKRPDGLTNYHAEYIDPSTLKVTECSLRQKLLTACTQGAEGFKNPLANRVNEVLKLYKDGEGAGLDTLSLAYKKALLSSSSHPSKSDDASPQSAQDQLIDGYAKFAARILFLANHDGLLASPASKGAISGGIGNLSRGLFGDTVTELFSPMIYIDNYQGKGNLEGRLRIQYVRVLQAIGNSILLSVNELREQEAALKQAPERARIEQLAIQGTATMNPHQVYAKLIHELTEETKGHEFLHTSLTNRAIEINKELAGLEPIASAQSTSAGWKKTRDSEKVKYDALQDKLKGALKLIESDAVKKALSTRADAPADVDAIWSTILKEVPKIVDDKKMAEDATRYLESIKSTLTFNAAAMKSYSEAWKEVANHLDAQRKTISDTKHNYFQYARLATLLEEKEENTKQTPAAEKKAMALTITGALAKTEKDAVTSSLEKQGAFVSGRGVYLTLALHLRKAMETLGTSEEEKKKKELIEIALSELNKRLPPSDFTAPAAQGYIDAKDVLDHEIAFLRQEHIQAVRTGESADAVGRAIDTLEAAAQHRAGMVYLRPATAYLRTSYPSTSLQDDPNLTWDNLLLQQGLRNIPLSSYMADLFNSEAGHDRSISADLDKQYWQNINRVRVSGAGKTNYVLAKDDVGNWYVKQYFGDTARIFESARKLGMYNLAPTLGTGLLASLKDKHPTDGGSTEDPQSTPLKRVFDKHQSAYSSKTTADVTTLKELAEKDVLAMKIKEGWDSLPDLKGEDETLKKIKDGLTSPLKTLKDRIAEIDKDNKTRDGVRVIQEIQAIRSFHQALNTGIESIDLPIPSSGSLSADKQKADTAKQEKEDTCKNGFPDPCKEAILQETYAKQNYESGKIKHDRTVKDRTAKVVADVLQEQLSSLVQGRQRLLQDYEQAILFVGDASKN